MKLHINKTKSNEHIWIKQDNNNNNNKGEHNIKSLMGLEFDFELQLKGWI